MWLIAYLSKASHIEACIKSPGKLDSTQIARPHPQRFRFSDSEVASRVDISDKLPSDVAAAGLGTTL